VTAEIEAVGRLGEMDVLRAGDLDVPSDVLIVSVGPMAELCLEAAALLDAQGISATVVDPRWVKPLDEALVPAARAHKLVVVVEDNGRVGGCGAAVAQLLRDAAVDVPLRDFGLPQRFLEQGKRDEVLADALLRLRKL
jgi:1-deoxy-D-xylulose-5-phosphate synthase